MKRRISFREIRLEAIVFAVAFAVRALPYPNVVTPVGVQFPYAGDLYYHMRRIWFSVANFPHSLRFDPYVSFPHGGEIVWPPAYDWTLAAIARLLVGGGDQGAVERVVIWAPPLMGAATALGVAWLAARFFGRAAGWWAGLLFAVLPNSYVYSQLGQLDHHVAVALATTALLGLAMATVARGDDATPAVGALLGLAMAAVLLLWPGALLHVGVVQAATGVWWLAAADRDAARRRGGCLAAAHATCAVAVAPFSIGNSWEQYGAWSPLVLSNFQTAYFGAVAAGISLATLLHTRSVLGSSRDRRILSAGVLALAAAAVGLALLPALRESLLYASGWFAKEEAFQENVFELLPLLEPRGYLDLGVAVRDFGFVSLLLPLVFAGMVWRAWRRRSAPEALLLAWVAVFVGLTLAQRRFGSELDSGYALLCGAALAEAFHRLRRSPALGRAPRMILSGGLLAVVLLTANSVLGFYVPVVARAVFAAKDEAYRDRGPLQPRIKLSEDAGRWLAAETPPTRGYLDPEQRPEYGVLCNWGAGHMLRYRSERPMVQDNFGVYGGRETYEAAGRYYEATNEEEAIAILESLGVRYVVAGTRGAGTTADPGPLSMTRRLAQTFGSEMHMADGGDLSGLHRHRLVFYARTSDAQPASARPHHAARPPMGPGDLYAEQPEYSLGVWEIVAGARVEGRATPGARVEARLELFTSTGLDHLYLISTRADAEGRYALVVPYPNDRRFSSAVRAADHYTLASGDRSAPLRVDETSVREGRIVEGPSL